MLNVLWIKFYSSVIKMDQIVARSNKKIFKKIALVENWTRSWNLVLQSFDVP